jgi:hypothetical protein
MFWGQKVWAGQFSVQELAEAQQLQGVQVQAQAQLLERVQRRRETLALVGVQ